MLETLQAWAGFTLVLMCGSFVLGFIFFGVGIRAAGIKKILLKRIIFVGAACSAVVYLTALIFLVIPGFNTVLGFAIGNILTLFIIKTTLSGTSLQSLFLWISNAAAHLLTVLVGAALFIGSLRDLLAII